MGRSADGRGAWMACCSWVGSVSGAGQGPETVSRESFGVKQKLVRITKKHKQNKIMANEGEIKSLDEIVNTILLL